MAVASCVLAIGSRAVHALPGLGLVVVQGGGWAEDSQVAFASLAAGCTAEQALRELRAVGRQDAQYALSKVEGQPVAWTGATTAGWSGHDTRPCVSVQGNTLVHEQVLVSCHAGWASAAGEPLEERLVAALAAGVTAGGDLRGQQSAALLSVDVDGAVHDLRVDGAATPVAQLRELLVVLRAHELLQRAWAAAPGDLREAAVLLRRAVALSPEDGLVAQSAALVFMQAGLCDEAASRWEVALQTVADPVARLRSWREQLPWVQPEALERLQALL